MRIKILKINQDDNIFYVGKIKARDLVNIATTKVRQRKGIKEYQNYLKEVSNIIEEKIDEGDVWYLKGFVEDSNIQRKQSKSRLKEIGQYIDKANSIFPNSIIINLSLCNNEGFDDDNELSKYIKVTDDAIEFDTNYVVANIIDGQHRLGGFEFASEDNLDKYELIITIMIGLEPAQQAELFGTINGKQKSVNKSVLYDLSAMTENEYTVSVTAHLITTWFNVNERSPLCNKIKMLGDGQGTISQAAMIEALVPLMKEKKLRVSSKGTDNITLPVFLKEFKARDSKKIIKYLYEYFKCFQKVFSTEWDYSMRRNDDKKYILNKTTGISGILIAYCTIYCYQYYNNDFSYNNMYSLISGLKGKIDFSSDMYEAGSKQIQKKLANDIINTLFTEEDVIKYRNEFIRNFNK